MRRLGCLLLALTAPTTLACDPFLPPVDGTTSEGTGGTDAEGSDGSSTGGTVPESADDSSGEPPSGAGPGCTPQITAESMQAAADALEAGEPLVNLDVNGCLQMAQIFDGDTLAHEELTRGGTLLEQWDHSPEASHGELEPDEAGVFQTRIDITRGESSSDVTMVTEKGVPTSWRQTITDTGTGLHVMEESGLDTAWPEVVEYDTDYYQEGQDEVQQGSGSGACSDQAADTLMANWSDALPQGLACLEDLGMQEAADALAATAARGVVFVCEDLSDRGIDAMFSPFSYYTQWLPRRPRIVVHGPSAGDLSLGLLFHELMHAHLPPHDHDHLHPWTEPGRTFNRYHVDQVYACQAMCFDVGGFVADKCTCATCLDTDPCDPRCADLPDCPAQERSICPCDDVEYEDEWACAVNCYNDLGCFDAPPCITQDFSCD